MYYNYSSMFTFKSFFGNGMVFWCINELRIANSKALEQTSILALILHHIQSQNSGITIKEAQSFCPPTSTDYN